MISDSHLSYHTTLSLSDILNKMFKGTQCVQKQYSNLESRRLCETQRLIDKIQYDVAHEYSGNLDTTCSSLTKLRTVLTGEF